MRLPMNTSLATLKPSGIRRINALAAQHPGCIALALGEPDFPTPDVISAEATASLNRGDTHYPPNNGRPALREALSAYMGDAGLAFSADEVILTDGATEALSATFMAMLNPGDEVIIPTPAFGLYESIVVANHAKAVFLDTEPVQFQIDEEALRACVTPATKAIVICSPNNPTGCILDAASLDAVARVAEQAGIYVVCDDVYNRLVYVDGYERFAQRHPELREQTVVIESFSKPWAMTGWRLGWLAAAAPVIAEIAKALEAAGADGLSVINSIQGMAIDVHTRKSRVAKPKGGLSGPLCHHIAVRMVWEVAQAVDIPINGVGGVMTGEDAAEFILAGATCVSVGMANFVDPCASLKIARELEAWAESQGVKDINELVGAFEC